MTTNLKYSMQVDVPHRYYGECKFSMPTEMHDWLKEYNLQYGMVGQTLWGMGLDENGITNEETIYRVTEILTREDCVAFKIRFPHVQISICEQTDWKKVYAKEAEKRAKKEARLKRRRDLYAAKKNSNLQRS